MLFRQGYLKEAIISEQFSGSDSSPLIPLCISYDWPKALLVIAQLRQMAVGQSS